MPFEIFLDFQGLRSLVPCSNHENGHSIIKNSYCWKFPILNQCDMKFFNHHYINIKPDTMLVDMSASLQPICILKKILAIVDTKPKKFEITLDLSGNNWPFNDMVNCHQIWILIVDF